MRRFSRLAPDLSRYDPTQVTLMKERLILVNPDDTPVGAISKRDGHTISYFDGNEFPHWAFSVFLFNRDWELLLQKRS